jgi:hypothetical protein
MHTNRNLHGSACRFAALSILVVGSAALVQAQQLASTAGSSSPLLLDSASTPASLPSELNLTSNSSSSSSSIDLLSDTYIASNGEFRLSSAALDSSQPPPRRYGRPNYSDSHSNPDGSPKYTFLGGFGLTLPVGDTHYYETPAWGLQIGGGRNFNKNVGVLLQFDYDHFGLQGATIANQEYIYNCVPTNGACVSNGSVSGLDGNNHVWSFTLNPTYTIATEGNKGAYLVVGGGFYHKVTNFTLPQTAEECSLYGCGYYTVDENVDHYTSNAGGVSGGFGLTYKFSKFSNERFYMEARYVLMLNSQRFGYTARNVATTSYNGYDAYPANSNRTTYIPVKFGIRF